MKSKDLKVALKGVSVARIRTGVILCLAVFVLAGSCVANAQSPAPVIFFSDLVDGPNSGGEVVSGFSGSYVTLYGNFFGTSQGTSAVKLNGANCLRVVSWGSTYMWYQKIVVQLGSTCSTGNFVVTTSAGTSNGLPFIVRAGNIYCVSTAGNNANNGKFPTCWATLLFAKDTIAAGDIIYALDGVSQTGSDSNGATLQLNTNGTNATTHCAMLAYPGATVTVSAAGQRIAIRNWASYWTVAGLTLVGGTSNAFGSGNSQQDARLVADDITCPSSSDANGCLGTGAPVWRIYGNNIHNVATSIPGSVTKLFHAVYIGDATFNVDFGWNTISNSKGNRGIQVYTSTENGPGDIYDIHIHDNLIHDVRGAGLIFAHTNTTNGPVEAYNNVIYNAGIGPDFTDGSTAWECLQTADIGTGAVQIYNNTIYNCGFNGGVAFEVFDTPSLRNNIFRQTASFNYISLSGGTPSCSNNLFFGVGAAPASCTIGTVNIDPGFNNLSLLDFHLASSSPAIDAGVTISSLKMDHDGVARPQGSAGDIGAYEYFAGGSTVQLPNPPTNLTVTVQ